MAVHPRCIVREAAAPASRPPLLFVHGAFTGAWCWDEYFLPYFSALGRDAWALDLRGHGLQAADDPFASIDDFVDDVLHAVARIGTPPVLVGHSMGAIVVQRALARSRAPAMVLMAPTPLQGLLGSIFLLAATNPELFSEINKLEFSAAGPSRAGLLRNAIFSPHLPMADVRRHLRRMRPESQRALFDLSWPQYFGITRAQVPVLVLAAQNDAFFPPHAVEESARLHGTTVEILPDIAHAMMLDVNWQCAAARIGDWAGLLAS